MDTSGSSQSSSSPSSSSAHVDLAQHLHDGSCDDGSSNEQLSSELSADDNAGSVSKEMEETSKPIPYNL